MNWTQFFGQQPLYGWALIIALIAGSIILYIYQKAKPIDDEMERKYAMLGTRGGKAEKAEEEEEENLMEFEKQEQKTYKNDLGEDL